MSDEEGKWKSGPCSEQSCHVWSYCSRHTRQMRLHAIKLSYESAANASAECGGRLYKVAIDLALSGPLSVDGLVIFDVLKADIIARAIDYGRAKRYEEKRECEYRVMKDEWEVAEATEGGKGMPGVILCVYCKEPIRDTGTADRDGPVHIACYHAAYGSGSADEAERFYTVERRRLQATIVDAAAILKRVAAAVTVDDEGRRSVKFDELFTLKAEILTLLDGMTVDFPGVQETVRT